MADIEMTDNFKGDDEKLVSCIRALVQLDDSGSLTSPLGGHARTMLEAACLRLAALIAENEQLRGALIEVRDSFAKVDAECFAATIWAIDAAMSKGGQGDEG